MRENASGPVTTSEDGRIFQQDRIRLLTAVIFALAAVFLILPFVLLAIFTSLELALENTFTIRRLPHVILVVILGATWAFVARFRLSTGALHVLDALIQLVCAGTVIPLVATFSTGNAGALTTALGLGHFLVLRAVVVPSSARRTFWTGAFISVGAVCSFALLSMFAPTLSDFENAVAPVHGLLNLGLWMLFAVASSTVASRVIFGLRREVKIARTLGQYELQRRLGEGGMGVVYEATHAMLRRRTAIKLVPPTKVDKTTIARFEREVRQTARLTHPNTISIYDFGRTPDGIFYYAMELLDGVDLQRLVQSEGPLPPGRVVRILAQVLASLREAHGSGLVHRDIKPANIMLTKRGGESDVVKVLDFGLVKELEAESSANLTATKTLTGTPMYMPPEAIESPADIGPASDLYAVAAVGYFLLTGTEVFPGATIIEVCAHHLHSEPEPPSERLGRPLPEDLCSTLLRGLRKKPIDRFASAAAFRTALLECSVAPWMDDDADAWWNEHGDSFRAPREQAPSPETLQIDLGRR